jgi:hypothetical protein
LPAGDTCGCGHRVFDVPAAAARGIRTMCDLTRCRLLSDHGGQFGAARRVVDRDESLQVVPPWVEPSALQHRSNGQRRRRRIVDHATRTAAVDAMPAPANGYPIHHMRCPQLNVALRQRFCEHCA